MVANTFDERMKEAAELRREFRVELLIVGLLLGFVGGWYIFGPGRLLSSDGYITNVFTELLSVGLTAGVFTAIIERSKTKELRKQLVRQAGSVDHQIAINAIEQMGDRKWTQGQHSLLKGAILARANLHHARLWNANLQDSNLQGINLEGAELPVANLCNANLWGAHLQKAALNNANLRNAKLANADLRKSDLLEADLRHADLLGADLENASLRGAILVGTNLQGANLSGTDMSAVYLQGADIRYANYRGSSLRTAILPDGTEWLEDTDMEKFTNPQHPEYKATKEKIQQIRQEIGEGIYNFRDVERGPTPPFPFI